jgi:hypothetical protein
MPAKAGIQTLLKRLTPLPRNNKTERVSGRLHLSSQL